MTINISKIDVEDDIHSAVHKVDFTELVKSEIDAFYAFKTAQGQLVSKYQNLIEKLYEFAPVIIAITDITNENAPYIYINKFAEKELGYKVHDIITGGSKFFSKVVHPDDRVESILKNKEFYNQLYTETTEVAEKLVNQQIVRIKHSKGNFIWFNLKTVLLSRKSDGSPHLVMTIMSNVNDSIKLQNEKQKRLSLEISLLKQKVKLQNERLQTQLLTSIESSKCFNGMVKYIQKVAEDVPSDQKVVLSQVIHYISRNKPDVNVWEDFIARFQDINPNFVSFLTTNYPNLTPTELKICSLTKTGLNSKDISSILKLSMRSVENHKYNIRKKFDLSPYQNLYNHLNTL